MSTRPLAQRRQPDRERVDAVVEVLAEARVADELLERPVGRRDQPEVDFDRRVAAEALEAPLLEHAQQLRLRDDRQVADFVEEQRAVVGELEAARLAVVGAGERALFVAEDFRLEQRVRQRGAVDRLELVGAAAAQLVDHPRHDFLARAGRPEDQHRDVRLRRGPDPLEDDQHLLVAADHLAEALNRRRAILVADGGAALEELVEQVADGVLLRLDERVPRRAAAGDALRDAERDQLADAVLDVEPHAAERLHQRLDVERFLRPWRRGSAAAPRAAATAPAPGSALRSRSTRYDGPGP